MDRSTRFTSAVAMTVFVFVVCAMGLSQAEAHNFGQFKQQAATEVQEHLNKYSKGKAKNIIVPDGMGLSYGVSKGA